MSEIGAIVSRETVEHLVATYGYAAVFLFIAIESVGVPFPGETALIVAAAYAGAGHTLAVPIVIAAAAAGAIAGDNLGFAVGRSAGTSLLSRYGRFVRLDARALRAARALFAHHGGRVVFFGRFVSILRTYAAFLAGTAGMPWRPFLAYNAAGGVLWALVYGVAAFYLGTAVEHTGTVGDIAGVVVAVAAVIVSTVLIRRQLARYADGEGPGPSARAQ